MNRSRTTLLVLALLFAATLFLYWPVRNHDFINYDDNSYVTENPHVLDGWTAKGLHWAFTSRMHGHWHPLTWLSHMTDVQLFGLNPAGHHLVSLAFHLANTLLLFLVLKGMTGALFRSAFVAALFAIHPLHVETVAWVADRKDLLSTFFWMLGLLAYTRYSRRPRAATYLLVVTAFVLGLMAKTMVVTFPLVLLLLDYWPLERLRLGQALKQGDAGTGQKHESNLLRLLMEKAVLIALLAASAAFALAVMKTATQTAFSFSKLFPTDLGRVTLHYTTYILKMLWPAGLAIPYPDPGVTEAWKGAAAGIFLLAMSFFVFLKGRRYPYLPVGWLWYLVTLLPVIGLVGMGPRELADRYTYIPLTGLFIMITWGMADLIQRRHALRVGVLISAVVVLLVLGGWARIQLGYWKDSVTLFTRTVEITQNNFKAHNNLGLALEAQGRLDEAVFHYSEAVRARPQDGRSRYNLALAYTKQGNLQQAMVHLLETVRLMPNHARAHNNLGIALARQGRLREAAFHFSEAIRLDPNYEKAKENLHRARQDLASPGPPPVETTPGKD